MKLNLTILLILCVHGIYAQLGQTENSLIEIHGKYFTREVDEKSILLIYKSQVKDDLDKIVPEIILYKIDKNNGKCFLEVYSSSVTATNNYVRLLNKMGVKVSDDRWENYTNNSKYILKKAGNIVSIEHSYINSNSSNSLNEELANCQKENENLNSRIANLKSHQAQLIAQIKDFTNLTSKGADNLEKALNSLKEKDEKIAKLQNVLKEKDEVVLKILKEKEDTITRLQNALNKKE